MANPAPIQVVTLRNATPVLMARVENAAGEYVTQASLSSIAYTAYLLDADHPTDKDTRTAVTGHEGVAVAKASAVFDTLQTASPWDSDEDAIGYNLKHQLDLALGDVFTIAGRTYLVVFTLTPTSGQVILVKFVVQVKE